jgi:hypothetical protein
LPRFGLINRLREFADRIACSQKIKGPIMPSEIPSVRALYALRVHRRHSATPDPPDASSLHKVFQNSTINALLEGVYNGSMTDYGELRRHGDFRLGTFNALDGEMIAFDEGFYQVSPCRSSPIGMVSQRYPDCGNCPCLSRPPR